jgi:hypothetical protein
MSPRSKPLHLLLAGGLFALAAPAVAAIEPTGPIAMPALPPAQVAAPAAFPGYDPVAFEEARADWLYECRRRYGGNDKGKVKGGIVGGVVGGVAGSAVAGRGNRTVGAIVGGVAGAAAGAAIGSAEDRRKARAARDYCETYLDDHLERQQYYGGYSYAPQGYAPQGYAAAYPQGYVVQQAMQPVTMMMMPVPMAQAVTQPAPQQNCTETTVIEEWVPVKARKRYIAPRRHVVPDKRVRIVPDKRIRTN